MRNKLRSSFLIACLLIGFGVLFQSALRGHCDKTYTDQEAYVLYMKNGINLTGEMENRICLIPFLMIVAGIGLSGFTFALGVESRAPVFGKVIRYLVVGVAILYFGASLFLMILG